MPLSCAFHHMDCNVAICQIPTRLHWLLPAMLKGIALAELACKTGSGGWQAQLGCANDLHKRTLIVCVLSRAAVVACRCTFLVDYKCLISVVCRKLYIFVQSFNWTSIMFHPSGRCLRDERPHQMHASNEREKEGVCEGGRERQACTCSSKPTCE